MNRLNRIRLFIRDYLDEFGVAWSVARMRDCVRNGGHRWGEVKYDAVLQAQGRTCGRCKCWESAANPEPIWAVTLGPTTASN